MTYQVTGGYPDLTTIRNWVKVATTSITDSELNHVAGAEQGLQASLEYGEGDIPDPVYQAFLRRVARHIAARGVPLGFLGLESESGPMALRRWDSEIERLEAPFVMPVVVGPYASGTP